MTRERNSVEKISEGGKGEWSLGWRGEFIYIHRRQRGPIFASESDALAGLGVGILSNFLGLEKNACFAG